MPEQDPEAEPGPNPRGHPIEDSGHRAVILAVAATFFGAALLLGSNFGKPFGYLGVAFMLLSSLGRLWRAWTEERGKHHPRRHGLIRFTVAVALTNGLLFVALIFGNRPIRALSFIIAMILGFVWFVVDRLCEPGKPWPNRAIGIFQLLERGAETGLHDIGFVGTRFRPSAILAACFTLLYASATWSVAAPAAGFPGEHRVRDAVKGADPSDILTPDPTVTVTVTAPQPSEQAPQTVLPSPTLACPVGFDSALRQGVTKRLGDALVEAARPFGSNIIGCSIDEPRFIGKVVVASFSGGESDPTLVVSDQLGRASVIFAPVVPIALRLINQGRLSFVEDRQAHGYGDYFIFHLRKERCMFVSQAFYASDYIAVGPSATRTIILKALRNRRFPLVRATATADDGTRMYQVEFEGESNIESIAAASARLEGTSIECPDTRALAALADQLNQRVEQEAPK